MAQQHTHTPGPWSIIHARPYDGDEVQFEGSYTSPASIEGSDGNPVCVFGTCEGSGALFENEADYFLIAAAPDRLAELRRDLAFVREIKSLLTTLRLVDTVQFQMAEMREAAISAAIAKVEGGAV